MSLNQTMIQILDDMVAVEELQPALSTEWDLLGSLDQYVPGDNEDGEC